MAKQFAYLEVGALSAVQQNLRAIRIPMNVTVEYIEVTTGANVAGDTTFNLRAGSSPTTATTIFASPSNRPTIPNGSSVGFTDVTMLAAISLTKDQWLVWDVDALPAGGISAPVTLTIRLEDNDPGAYGAEQITTKTIVNDFYNGALARVPTTTEFNTQKGLLDAARGNVIDYIAAMKALGVMLFTSAEYVARGRSDSQFVDDLYAAFLARSTPPEGAAWVTMVGTSGRTVVLDGFRDSDEFYERRITKSYWLALKGYDAASLLGAKLSALPADGQTFKYQASSGTFIPANLGGGSTGSNYPHFDVDAPSASPSTLDDDFNSSPLNSKWTKAQGVEGTDFDVHTTKLSALHAGLSSANVQLLQALPSGDFTCVGKFRNKMVGSGTDPNYGLFLANANDSTGIQTFIGVGYNLNWILYCAQFLNSGYNGTIGTNKPTFYAQSDATRHSYTAYQSWIYIKLRRSGTTYYWSWSPDGEYWQDEQSDPFSHHTSGHPNYIGLIVIGCSTHSTVDVDNFRFYASGNATLGNMTGT